MTLAPASVISKDPAPLSGLARRCLSELLGTYILVFVGPASVVLASLAPHASALEQLVLVAFVFGSTVASIIVFLGEHSGAHVNPAITVASTLAGTHRREHLIPYVAFQVVGALFAGLSLKLLFSGLASSAYLGSTEMAAGMNPIEGVSLEAAGTFVLALSALSAGSYLKTQAQRAALVGCTLFILIIAIGPLTGASFNPARSLGPALFSGYLSGLPFYLLGPLIGAVLAGLLFGATRKDHAEA
ncbi:MAG TPA: aquaporin [Nitrososphaerales archaeon]|nr:aquaporin [Nitrososphaerales archaeon]